MLTKHQCFHDDKWPGADYAGDVYEYGDRPAGGETRTGKRSEAYC